MAETSIPLEVVMSIRTRYLLDPLATIKSLSEETGIKAYKVASLLKGPQFDAFKQAFHEAQANAARDKLASYSEDAALMWRQSFPAAVAKGDHRPMRDLLIANKIIDPQATAPHVTVQVGLALDLGAVLSGTPKALPIGNSTTPTDPPTIDVPPHVTTPVLKD